jgi:subtilase family serine protease
MNLYVSQFVQRAGVAKGSLRRGLYVAICSGMLAAGIPLQAQSVLTHHVREDVNSGRAQLLNRLPESQTLRLDVVLPLRDSAGLEQFVQDVYNPSSASYRHFLTVPEFTARFGPTQEDYDALVAYATSHGFAVAGGSRDAMDVQIEGSVKTIETAFHVSMGVYQHPTENRTFYAPDREPSVDLPIQLWHVSGLDNYSTPHPLYHHRDVNPATKSATKGSGPSASFLGSDMRAAYYTTTVPTGGTILTGAGQNIGLLEYYGYDIADLNTYYTNAGQTNLSSKVTGISTDGTSLTCTYTRKGGDCDDTEQILDMTQAMGMAPGITALYVYVGSTDTAILGSMTTRSPLPLQLSSSWTWSPADPSTDDPYFEKMAAQGQSFFQASGDSESWSKRNDLYPSEDPYVICVGGTDLTTSSAAGPWSSEVGWADGGGGISPDHYAIPSWQKLAGVITSSNKGSTSYRNGPDVSANANFTFYVCADQTTCTANEYGGTSFAAPMWAGLVALANQQAATNSVSPVGFLNPAIYAIGVSSSYGTDFHDITSGNNGYPAVTGYDLDSGWGSPKGYYLINKLVP